jgi:hypothetical protein
LITINTEKGLTKVSGWQDILERPGFDSNLDPEKSELETIIGRYIFADKVKCGLSCCHTPHAKGYLVATKDGGETNIGKDCGKKYFGVDFETLSKKFDRDVTESDNREALWSLHFQLDELESKIHQIREGESGANVVHKHSQQFLKANSGCPRPVRQKISELLRSGSNILTAPRLATESEVEDLEVIEKRKIERPHYIDEVLAEIEGIEILYKENDLREILVKNLSQNMAQFKSLDIDQMSYKDLQYWVKWKGTIDLEIEKGVHAVARGVKFLKKDNLISLVKVPMEKEEVTLFKKFLSSVVLKSE